MARRRDRDELDVFVTEPEHTVGDVIGASWRRLGEDAAAPLSRWLSWSVTPPPVEAPQSVRYDVLARGVDVQSPTLHEWARTLLDGGVGDSRARTAALALQLETRHKEVLDLLGRHPYLSDDEIAERLRVSVQLIRRVIRDLLRHGLIVQTGDSAGATR